MNFRLTGYWNALRGDEPYARITEFNVETIPGFGQHAFMLDLLSDAEDPMIRFAGQRLSAECGRNVTGQRLSVVPLDSLLGRVAKHYRQVIEEREPCEFAAEYEKNNKDYVLYRGIMLPFTKDGKAIDYIVGAITSKTLRQDGTAVESMSLVEEAGEIPGEVPHQTPVRVEDRGAAPADEQAGADGQDAADEQDARSLIALVEAEMDPDAPAAAPADPGTLSATLLECRSLAKRIDAAESRSRKALYDTLDRVYAFHLEAEANPAGFEALAADAGLTVQARAPFTPIVKLVFGVDYDKTRLSEYATALSYAKRRNQTATSFRGFLEAQDGGLKGCIKAERAARRSGRGEAPDTTDEARELLRRVTALGLVTETEPGADEFVLMLGRRTAAQPGVIEVLSVLDEKPAVLDGVLRRSAKKLQGAPPCAPKTRTDSEAGA